MRRAWRVGLARVLLAGGVALLVFGLVLVLLGRPRDYAEAIGTVVAVREITNGDDFRYDTTIEVLLGGEYLRFESAYGHRDAMGEQVAVFYDPQNPLTTFETDEDRSRSEWLWLGLGIVLVSAAIGMYVWHLVARPQWPRT